MRILEKRLAFLGVLLGLLLALTAMSPAVAMAANEPVTAAEAGEAADASTGGAADGGAGKFDFNKEVIDFGSDINSTSFTPELKKIFNGMNTVFKSIMTILTVASAAMLVLGIEDGKKTMWQFMLGIGLAYNFGYTLWLLFSGTGIFESVDSIVASHNNAETMDATKKILENSKANGNDDILTQIMAVYSGTILHNGMPVLQAIALRLTVALAAIEGGYKIAMELYSGDKVKFLVATAFKVGFFCFLIKEWADIGQALSAFFQSAGFLAAGESGFGTTDPTATDNDTTFRPDSIWHNAWAFLNVGLLGKKAEAGTSGFPWADQEDGLANVALSIMDVSIGTFLKPLVILLFLLVIVGAMIFISVEMFVARIEFYTMMMLSVIFLPFGVTERLAFLSNSAISLMFNSGAKMMVICFLQVMIAKILGAYLTNLTASPFANLSSLVQMSVMCIFFAYITKKIPDLVSSFLNGSPALSGGGMIQQVKATASQAVSVAAGVGTGIGAVSGASAVASAKAGSGLSGKMSTLPGMKGTLGHAIDTVGVLAQAGAQNYMARNPVTQGFARGMKGVVGDNGDLQNQSFEKGLRRLAGLETDAKDKPTPTRPIEDVAEHGWPKDGGNGGSGGGTGVKQETSGGNEPDTKGKDGTRVSHLKDLQTMDQEMRLQTISSMSNQEMQQLVQGIEMKDMQSLTQKQQKQLENFSSQKDVDNMTKEQRQQINTSVAKLAQPPKK